MCSLILITPVTAPFSLMFGILHYSKRNLQKKICCKKWNMQYCINQSFFTFFFLSVAGMLQVSPDELASALTTDVQYFKGNLLQAYILIDQTWWHFELPDLKKFKSCQFFCFLFLIWSCKYFLWGICRLICHAVNQTGPLNWKCLCNMEQSSFTLWCWWAPNLINVTKVCQDNRLDINREY